MQFQVEQSDCPPGQFFWETLKRVYFHIPSTLKVSNPRDKLILLFDSHRNFPGGLYVCLCGVRRATRQKKNRDHMGWHSGSEAKHLPRMHEALLHPQHRKKAKTKTGTVDTFVGRNQAIDNSPLDPENHREKSPIKNTLKTKTRHI